MSKAKENYYKFEHGNKILFYATDYIKELEEQNEKIKNEIDFLKKLLSTIYNFYPDIENMTGISMEDISINE